MLSEIIKEVLFEFADFSREVTKISNQCSAYLIAVEMISLERTLMQVKFSQKLSWYKSIKALYLWFILRLKKPKLLK